jgi:hypothetical protein
MIALHDGDDDKLNLSALDPDADPRAAERFVQSVMGRVEARPRPEVLPADPLVGIWSLARSPGRLQPAFCSSPPSGRTRFGSVNHRVRLTSLRRWACLRNSSPPRHRN